MSGRSSAHINIPPMTAVMPSIHWREHSADKENIFPHQAIGMARPSLEAHPPSYQSNAHPPFYRSATHAPHYQFGAACATAVPTTIHTHQNPRTAGPSFQAHPPYYQFNAACDTAPPPTIHPQQNPGIAGQSFEPHTPFYQFHAQAPPCNFNATYNPSLPHTSQAVKVDSSAPMGMTGPETERAAHARPPVKRHRSEDSDDQGHDSDRKRLSRSQLEFDWDRTQLRDPRLTPGREVPPRRDVADPFHELYVCYDKGPHGSPTYDQSGFQLDYNKVAAWMRPISSIPRGTRMARKVDRRLKKHQEDMDKMANLFFVGGKGPAREEGRYVEQLLKDKVSKDLGIPYHRVGVPEVEKWARRGFPKQNPRAYVDATVTEEEKKRFLYLLTGGSLRK